MIAIDELPNIIPLFPLGNVILLPGRELPLNIFEPRYLSMVRDVHESHGMIGMLQPRTDEAGLYEIGGAGRISEWQETEDGRIELVLTGISRFALIEEVDGTNGYRRALVDWHQFAQDLRGDPTAQMIDSEEVSLMLERFFASNNLEVEWQGLDSISGGDLVDALAMNLSFPPEDKQALLEAHDAQARYNIMRAIANLYSSDAVGGSRKIH